MNRAEVADRGRHRVIREVVRRWPEQTPGSAASSPVVQLDVAAAVQRGPQRRDECEFVGGVVGGADGHSRSRTSAVAYTTEAFSARYGTSIDRSSVSRAGSESRVGSRTQMSPGRHGRSSRVSSSTTVQPSLNAALIALTTSTASRRRSSSAGPARRPVAADEVGVMVGTDDRDRPVGEQVRHRHASSAWNAGCASGSYWITWPKTSFVNPMTAAVDRKLALSRAVSAPTCSAARRY